MSRKVQQEEEPTALDVRSQKEIANDEPLDTERGVLEEADNLVIAPMQRKPNECPTISSIVKCMLGSIVLLLPTNFGKYGMGISLIVMFVIALACWKTSCWIVLHTLASEIDMAQAVQRILGTAWKYVFLAGSIVDVFLIVIIYFNLLVTTMYPLINAILVLSGIQESLIPTPAQIVWDYWSLQYMAIILMALIYPLMLIKDISKMVKMGVFGFASLVGYVIFIIYIFIENLVMDRASALIPGTTETYWDRYEWFLRTGNYTETVTVLTGNFALAFATHNIIAQIMANNVRQEKNVFCVSLGYFIGFMFYAAIGVLGSFGILGRNQQFDETRIMDYFTATAWEPIIVEVLFSLHMFTSIPIYHNIPKIQVLIVQEPCFKKDETPKNRKKYSMLLELLYTTMTAIVSLLCSIFLIDINMVIGLAGAVACYIFVYLCPIFMHYYCVKSKKRLMDLLEESGDDYEAIAIEVREIVKREKAVMEEYPLKLSPVENDQQQNEAEKSQQKSVKPQESEHNSREAGEGKRIETEDQVTEDDGQLQLNNDTEQSSNLSLNERLENLLTPT